MDTDGRDTERHYAWHPDIAAELAMGRAAGQFDHFRPIDVRPSNAVQGFIHSDRLDPQIVCGSRGRIFRWWCWWT